MPWLPMYVNEEDSKLIFELLNDDKDIAYVVSDGKKKWKAVETIKSVHDGIFCIWHIPSGPLPLLGGFLWNRRVQDPWAGWKEKQSGADSDQPYFGPEHSGVIWLNLHTCSVNEPSKIGLSSFEWIGNHYKIIGRPAPEVTKKWWEALRKSIAKMTVKLPRGDDVKLKNEVFTFPSALKEIENGREKDDNP